MKENFFVLQSSRCFLQIGFQSAHYRFIFLGLVLERRHTISLLHVQMFVQKSCTRSLEMSTVLALQLQSSIIRSSILLLIFGILSTSKKSIMFCRHMKFYLINFFRNRSPRKDIREYLSNRKQFVLQSL